MPRDDRRILVGLDAGETAAAVLSVARRFASAIDAALEAVHVGDHVPPSLAELAAAAEVEVAARPGSAVPVLTDHPRAPGLVAAVVGCRGVDGPRPAGHVTLGLAQHATPDLDLALRAGHPGEQLLDVITATSPDLIVLGWSQDLSPGHARVIRELLQRSPVPLLLVPTDDAGRPAGDPERAARGGPDR